MLVVHQFIDVLKGVPSKYSLAPLPGAGATKGDREGTARRLLKAEKFDFGDLMLERQEDQSWTLPRLSDVERGFWLDNLIPLPAPICWFEFALGGIRSGLLVEEISADLWGVERLDLVPPKVVYDGVVVHTSRNECKSSGVLRMRAVGNADFLNVIQHSEIFVQKNLGANVPLAMYLTLMINSKTTEVRRSEPAPVKLNKKRARKGKAPLVEHRIVRIIPDKIRYESEAEAQRTHASPRLHWRRSHLRHYDHHVPSAKWAPELLHEGKTGWWVSVIPRFLVGKAENGEVSHEYRVEKSQIAEED